MGKSTAKPMKNYAVTISAKVNDESIEQRLFIVESGLDMELFTRLMTYTLNYDPIILGTIDLHLKDKFEFASSLLPLPSMFVSLGFFIDPEVFTDKRTTSESIWCLLRASDAQALYRDWKSDTRYMVGKAILARRKNEPSKDGKLNKEDGKLNKEDDEVYYANKVDNFGWMADKRWPGQFKLETLKASRSNKRKTS
jgi:hypothetical protein